MLQFKSVYPFHFYLATLTTTLSLIFASNVSFAGKGFFSSSQSRSTQSSNQSSKKKSSTQALLEKVSPSLTNPNISNGVQDDELTDLDALSTVDDQEFTDTDDRSGDFDDVTDGTNSLTSTKRKIIKKKSEYPLSYRKMLPVSVLNQIPRVEKLELANATNIDEKLYKAYDRLFNENPLTVNPGSRLFHYVLGGIRYYLDSKNYKSCPGKYCLVTKVNNVSNHGKHLSILDQDEAHARGLYSDTQKNLSYYSDFMDPIKDQKSHINSSYEAELISYSKDDQAFHIFTNTHTNDDDSDSSSGSSGSTDSDDDSFQQYESQKTLMRMVFIGKQLVFIVKTRKNHIYALWGFKDIKEILEGK